MIIMTLKIKIALIVNQLSIVKSHFTIRTLIRQVE